MSNKISNNISNKKVEKTCRKNVLKKRVEKKCGKKRFGEYKNQKHVEDDLFEHDEDDLFLFDRTRRRRRRNNYEMQILFQLLLPLIMNLVGIVGTYRPILRAKSF